VDAFTNDGRFAVLFVDVGNNAEVTLSMGQVYSKIVSFRTSTNQ
jgi:hypothetical protein